MAGDSVDSKWELYAKTAKQSDFVAYLRAFVITYGSNPIALEKKLTQEKLPNGLLDSLSAFCQRHKHVLNLAETEVNEYVAVIHSLTLLIRNDRNVRLISALSINPNLFKLIEPIYKERCENCHFELLKSFVEYLADLFDPHGHRQAAHSGAGLQQQKICAQADDLVVRLISESFFSDKIKKEYEYKQALIHLLRAVICGSRQNAHLVICPVIQNMICDAFRAHGFHHLIHPTSLRRDMLQCLELMVHILHNKPDPSQRKLEIEDLVGSFLTVVEEIPGLYTGTPDKFIPILETVKNMISGQLDLEALRASFIAIHTLPRLIAIIRKIAPLDTAAGTNKALMMTINCLYEFFHRSEITKKNFVQTVGYEQLLEVSQSFGEPTQTLLLKFFELVVENEVRDLNNPNSDSRFFTTSDIRNPGLLNMLIKWLPQVTDLTMSRWLAEQLITLCTYQEKNRIICCSSGIVMTAIKTISEHSLYETNPRAAGHLMRLVEKLGSLSISAAEVKQLLLLVQQSSPLKTAITMRVMQAFVSICDAQSTIRALHYFSLPSQHSSIEISTVRGGLIKDNFTFHCWLCVEGGTWERDHGGQGIRRILYRFQAANGAFESFINAEGHLYVAISIPSSKRSPYQTFLVTKSGGRAPCKVADGNWHMVDIVLRNTNFLQSTCPWNVYIDGVLQITCEMEKLTLSGEPRSHKYKIAGPITDHDFQPSSQNHSKPRSILSRLPKFPKTRISKSLDTQHMVECYEDASLLGIAMSLHGCLGTIVVFSDSLDYEKIQHLHQLGPNAMALFWSHPLKPLKEKRVFHYNAKMFEASSNKVIDLSHYGRSGKLIRGHTCCSGLLKNMVECIGGVQTFIPLLQNFQYEENPTLPKELFDVEPKLSHITHNLLGGFFNLLSHALKNCQESQEHVVQANSMQTITALIEQMDKRFLNEDTFNCIQELFVNPKPVTSGDRSSRPSPFTPALQNQILKHLLMDFRLWQGTNTVVQIGHAQLLLRTTMESSRKEFKQTMSVQTLLDAVKQYYSQVNHQPHPLPLHENIDREMRRIRESIYHIIKIITIRHVNKQEVTALINFVLCCESHDVMSEVLELIYELVAESTNDQIHLLMMETDAALYLYDLIVDPSTGGIPRQEIPSAVKIKILELMKLLLSGHQVLENSKVHLRMEQYGIGGVTYNLLGNSAEQECLISPLWDIVMSVPTGKLANYRNLLTIISLCEYASLNTKLEITSRLHQLIEFHPTSVKAIVEVTGWQYAILCLLINKHGQRPEPNSPTTNLEESYVMIPTPTDSLELLKEDNTDPASASDKARTLHANSESIKANTPPTVLRGPNTILKQTPMSPHSFNGASANVQTESAELEAIQGFMLRVHTALIWHGLSGSSEDVWQDRLKVLHGLHAAASLIVDPIKYLRLLFEKLLQLAGSEVKDHTPADPDGFKNGRELIKIVYKFLDDCCKGGYDQGFSKELLDSVLHLLEERMTVWHTDTYWEDLAYIGLAILVLCAIQIQTSDDITMLAYQARARICNLVSDGLVRKGKEELSFIIAEIDGKIKEINRMPLLHDDDRFSSLLKVILSILLKHRNLMNTISYPELEQLLSNERSETALKGAFRREDDLRLIVTSEMGLWGDFMEQISESCNQHRKRLLEAAEIPDLKNREITAEVAYDSDRHYFQIHVGSGKIAFQNAVTNPVLEEKTKEKKRYALQIQQKQHTLNKTLTSWQSTMHFFNSQRGTWPKRSEIQDHWIRSTHENYSRMRLKFMPNSNFDPHTLASHRRDQSHDSRSEVTEELEILKGNGESGDEDDDDAGSDTASKSEGGERAGSSIEAIDESESEDGELYECSIITMFDPVAGQMKITNMNLYFIDTETRSSVSYDVAIPLDSIREVHLRLRTLQKTAMELFLTDQTNYFFNFPDKVIRRQVLRKLKRVTNNKTSIYDESKKLSTILADAKLTERWRRREISNFNYLMELNTIAGRTYNDWTQYPVFPWILNNYTTEELDLDDPKNYRDLTKPVGILGPNNEAEKRNRYIDMEQLYVDTAIPPHHYGQHYSAAPFVMHYLLRVEPFTSQHIILQSERFDLADRQFHSINASYRSLLSGMQDVKELIPEFFCMPELLINHDKFDLGVRQHDGEVVDNVKLPPWARNPYDFLWKHRKALESDVVSQNLHNWIDLIFGYKQRGPEAINAVNVFHPNSYEGTYVRERTDITRRDIIERQINEFGQTPRQILTTPHPARLTHQQMVMQKIQENTPISLLPIHKESMVSFRTQIYTKPFAGNIVVACVPSGQVKNLMISAYDKLVTISDTGVIGQHDWSPCDHNINHKFELYKNYQVDDPKSGDVIRGPFQPGMPLAPNRLAVSYEAKQIFIGGYWDNSLRVFFLRQHQTQAIHAHNGVVTCLRLDAAGEYLITGSADTTCKIWKVVAEGGVNPQAHQCLYGHDDEVSAVAISIEYDMAVTGSKDGTVNIHTVKKGLFVRTLDLKLSEHHIIQDIQIANMGQILILSQPNPKFDNALKAPYSMLDLYSLNGQPLACLKSHHIAAMALAEDYIFIGSKSGNLYIYELGRLEGDYIDRYAYDRTIRCLSFTRNFTHLFIGVGGDFDLYISGRNVGEPHLRPGLFGARPGL